MPHIYLLYLFININQLDALNFIISLFKKKCLYMFRALRAHHHHHHHHLLLLLLPLALQPPVGFGLSKNVLPFFPICHHLSPSSNSQHLKNSFYFLFPSIPGSSPSSRPFQFLSENLFWGILSSSILSR